MLQEKTLDDNNGLRVLVRMESNDIKVISDIPPESGFTLKRKILATENEALIIGDFVGPLMQMIAQTKIAGSKPTHGLTRKKDCTLPSLALMKP